MLKETKNTILNETDFKEFISKLQKQKLEEWVIQEKQKSTWKDGKLEDGLYHENWVTDVQR